MGDVLGGILRRLGHPGGSAIARSCPPGTLRVYRYPGFVQAVISPLNDDGEAVAADPSNPPRIGFFTMQARWFVPLGSLSRRGPLHHIQFIGDGKPSSVFSMKTISGFFRYTTGHRASVLDIT